MTTNIVIFFSILVSGLLTILVINYLLNSRFKNKLTENEIPIAHDIFKSVLYISSGLLISQIVTSFQTLLKVLPSSFTGNDLLLKEFSYFSIFLGLTILTEMIIIWIATLMFSFICKGKSIFMEVSNNNLNAVAVFIGLQISLTIASMPALVQILEQFIPYPSLPIYH